MTGSTVRRGGWISLLWVEVVLVVVLFWAAIAVIVFAGIKLLRFFVELRSGGAL